MSSCTWLSGDPVDRELHAAGCCLCQVYRRGSSPWRREPLPLDEARRLAGLFGFDLVQRNDGLWVAFDESRGIQVPAEGGSHHTGHTLDTLDNLIVRARCADSLAGPMTISEAREQLAAIGFELRTRVHNTWGREWWAVSQAREVTTGTWLHLKNVVEAAQSYLIEDRYSLTRQYRMSDLTQQLPIDLDPKTRRERPKTPWSRRRKSA